jgi:hypothetical protein
MSYNFFQVPKNLTLAILAYVLNSEDINYFSPQNSVFVLVFML